MMKLNLTALILFFVIAAQAQEPPPQDPTLNGEAPVGSESGTPAPPLSKPKGRQKQRNNVQPNESSSFIGDSDNIDPLKPNRDNIKDDNEPVLEDIKDVLNADMSKKAGADGVTPSDGAGATAVDGQVNAGGGADAGAGAGSNLVSDDPDLDLEKKFHTIYQRYNKNPTPADAWAAASSKQVARLYEVQKGDTLWSISQVLFGDPNFWPKLWAINKQGILNPHFINPKMKIYFYEGDESNSPTLSIGQQATIKPGSPGIAEMGSDNSDENKSESEESKVARVSEVQPVNDSLRVARRPDKPVTEIPDSLPVGRNVRFHDQSNRGIRLDIATPKVNELSFKNNVVVSDAPIKSDIELKGDSVYRAACSAGRAFGDLKLNYGQLEGEYEIYEALDGFESISGHKYAYRQIGTAEAYKGNLLKVTECIGLNSEFLIMQKGRARDFVTKEVTNEPTPKIVGGPDYGDRNFFSLLTFAFVDFGPKSFDVGGTYSSISRDTASPNGQMSVIEKYGSYGLVVFTSVSDLVELGDKVASPDDLDSARATPPPAEPDVATPASSTAPPPETTELDLQLEDAPPANNEPTATPPPSSTTPDLELEL